MKFALALIATLACASAGAQPRNVNVGGQGGHLNVPLSQIAATYLPTIATSDECTCAAVTGTHGEAVTVSRSSSATCTKSDGTLVTCSADQPRVEADGLRVESGITNLFLTSDTPATQTITLTTGTFTGWMDGTGSIAFAVGTATATGLPCTSSDGTACTFSVSVAGTVTATVTGSPTRAQVEKSPLRTSYVASAGTAAARANETATATNPIDSEQWCMGAEVVIPDPVPTSGGYGIVSTGSATATDSFSLYLSVAAPVCFTTDSASGTKFQAYPSLAAGSYFIQCCQGPTGPAVYVDGLPSGNARTGTGGLADIGTRSTLYLGTRAGSFTLNSNMKNVKACRSPVPSSCGAPVAAVRVDTIGDSITALGGANAWPVLMDSLLGSEWVVFNKAVSGSQTDAMITKYESEAQGANTGGLQKFVTLIGGVNDIKAGVSASTVYDNLMTIVDEARADGATVVMSTVLPFKNYTGWTSTYQTELESLNTMIRANSHGATLIDGYALFGDPSDSAALNSDYDSGDGLHPNDAGHQYLAELFEAVLSP